MKDGGGESTVTGYFLIESKRLVTVVLLRFDGPSREAYHEHAFNCVSWLLAGRLQETFANSKSVRRYTPSWLPFITRRSDFHKVSSETPRSWVLSIRGPWSDTWREQLPLEGNRVRTLTHGREELP